MISFLVVCLIILVVLYVAKLIMAEIPLPDSVKNIAWLIIGLIALLVLIQKALATFGGGQGLGIQL